MSRSLKTPALATLAGSLVLAGTAFASTPLSQGYMLSAADAPPPAAAKTAEAKCGADKAKAGEMKCGADKAGEAWRLKVYALTPRPGATQPSTKPADAGSPRTDARS